MHIYIHWPFCLQKCPYCDFNSYVSNKIDHNLWLRKYLENIDLWSDVFYGQKIDSIFFGGGTPSLMKPASIAKIIDQIAKYGDISLCEISMEMNPTSASLEFKDTGINRVSIGIQSFIDADLKFLGREHSASEALKTIENIATNFKNYSFDLIYARPNQSLKNWKDELKNVLDLDPPHVSLYQLTIEPGTKFYHLFHKKKAFDLPTQDLASDMYFLTEELLSNYRRYEISNYTKDNMECVHNMAYWRYRDFLGIGPGAHSRLGNKSLVMPKMPEKWLQDSSPQEQILSTQDIIFEMIMMSLRTSEGINLEDFEKKTQCDLLKKLDFSKFDELLLLRDGFLSLSKSGMNLHNAIVLKIIESIF